MAFPDDRDRELQRKSLDAVELADELIDWVSAHNAQRGLEELHAIRPNDEFRLLNLRRRSANLYRSSRVPVAAAVYGASQVGKSLFVGRVLQPQHPDFSPLGRDEKLGPPAYEPKLSFDYDINPRCAKNEATAIVTRFTTKDRFPEDVPADFPVLVRALSRAEWLRVLARGFQSECDMDKNQVWDADALERLFEELSKTRGGEQVDRHWRMDLLDAYTYLRRTMWLRYRADESEFNALVTRYPLSDEGYVEAAARLCWDGWPDLTALFHRIGRFLERIAAGEKGGLLAHWAAVRFLLDSQLQPVHTSEHSRCFPQVAWTDIVDREVDGWYVLDYQPGQGPPSEEPAVIQSALLELVIPVLPDRLSDDWRRVLERIDFLDIPGMRAEGKGSETGLSRSAETLKKQTTIVKRGKVFYLFDRYIEDLQAQTLLLLIRGENLEVRGLLKEYVDKWGKARYGDAWPRQVKDDPPALFLGMTGIDDEFRNERAAPALYDARLREIDTTFEEMMTHFGGENRPFRNVYPIRYPGTWDADENRRNLEGPERWEHAGRAFLESEQVRRYVAEAEKKWAAALRDGDGGASLIAAAFRQTTSAVRKQDELQKGIDETRQRLLQMARSWVVDPNANADRQRRTGLARTVLEWLRDDGRFVYDRVYALEASLCFRHNDVLTLADLADIRTSSRNPSKPIEARLPDDLQEFLHEWGRQWAVERWKDHTARHANGGTWLEAESFAFLARYLADYLCSPAVFPELCSRLLTVAALRVPDEGAKRQARRKYVRLILNDYVMNPGPDAVPLEEVDDSNGAEFGLMAGFVTRWMSRLPAVLAAGAGENIGIPPGNDELIALLNQFDAPRL